jgi:CBS domain-containing protein
MIGRICTRDVDTAQPNETVHAIAQRMHQRAVGSLVVVNEANEPVGIVTDRDLVSRVLAREGNPMEIVVRSVMTADPKTVSDSTAVESALALMRSGSFRRLPVVDQNHKLIGLVCLDDILMLLAEEFMQVGRLLERETPAFVVAGAR